MSRVFVSYSRKDGAWVVPMVDRLGAIGVETWIDQRALPVSLPWLDEIQDAIEEAVVVLVCDSPSWRDSSACAAERAIADDLGKQFLTVTVGSDIAAAALHVAAAVQRVPKSVVAATELHVRARNWVRAGRPKGALVSWRVQRRLRRSLAAGQVKEQPARAFVRASARRTARRSVWTASLVVVAVLGGAVIKLLPDVRRSFEESNQQLADRTAAKAEIHTAMSRNVYDALEVVAALGDNEGFIDADSLATALEPMLPDDAFGADQPLVRFRYEVVDADVVVEAADGTVYRRAAEARDLRDAEVASGRLPEAQVVASSLAVDPDASSGVVTIRRNGVIYRRIVLDGGPVSIVALSPNERWLAAAHFNRVVIVDVESGLARSEARGTPTMLSDLAWSADSQRLWAVAGGRAMSWTVVDARVLVDEPGSWFQAVITHDDDLWVVDRAGTFRQLDSRTGEEHRRVELGHPIYSVTHGTTDKVFAVSDDASWVVDLVSGSAKSLDDLECTGSLGLGGMSTDGTAAFVPCTSGRLFVIDLNHPSVIGSIEVEHATSAAVSSDGRHVHVGTARGDYVEIDLNSAQAKSKRPALTCAGDLLDVDVHHEAIVGVGYGAGRIGCVVSTANDGSTWNNWLHVVDDSTHARSVEFVDNGRAFAVGLSNGDVVVSPTENLLPHLTIHAAAGAVRDLSYAEATGELFVATRDGMVLAVPVRAEDVTNVALAATARGRLARAAELGLDN
jgi:hypothetical protein